MFLRPQNCYAREKRRAVLGKKNNNQGERKSEGEDFWQQLEWKEERGGISWEKVTWAISWNEFVTYDKSCRAALLLWLERKMSIHNCGPRRETLKMLIDMLVWCLLWLRCQCKARWRRTEAKTGGHVLHCWECEEESESCRDLIPVCVFCLSHCRCISFFVGFLHVFQSLFMTLNPFLHEKIFVLTKCSMLMQQ